MSKIINIILIIKQKEIEEVIPTSLYSIPYLVYVHNRIHKKTCNIFASLYFYLIPRICFNGSFGFGAFRFSLSTRINIQTATATVNT